MSLNQISAVIIVKDAAGTLAQTLDSLAYFAEVIVYDNGSTDGSQALCGECENVKLHEGAFLGFGPSKNHAVSLAANDWVLSIDSDETVSAALRDSIDKADLSDPKLAYEVDRHNYFMGRRVRHSGWSNDWLLRLYNRSAQAFNEAMVHEIVILSDGSKTMRLDGPLRHKAVNDLGQFLVKINRYSEIRRNTAKRTLPVAVILFKTVWAFFRTYVIRLGFLDGWRGLVIAISNANGVFFKYMKPFADRATRNDK